MICEGFEEGEDELSRRKGTERIEVRDEICDTEVQLGQVENEGY